MLKFPDQKKHKKEAVAKAELIIDAEPETPVKISEDDLATIGMEGFIRIETEGVFEEMTGGKMFAPRATKFGFKMKLSKDLNVSAGGSLKSPFQLVLTKEKVEVVVLVLKRKQG